VIVPLVLLGTPSMVKLVSSVILLALFALAQLQINVLPALPTIIFIGTEAVLLPVILLL